jgi:hypothetical protein
MTQRERELLMELARAVREIIRALDCVREVDDDAAAELRRLRQASGRMDGLLTSKGDHHA